MPRALISDVRTLAASDHCVLPFLAPRVFAEPPKRRVRRHHAHTSTSILSGLEIEGDVSRAGNVRSAVTVESKEDTSGLQHGCRRASPSPNFIPFGRKLPTSANPHKSRALFFHSDAMRWRYTDIYTFARGQLAAYSSIPTSMATEGTNPRAEHVEPLDSTLGLDKDLEREQRLQQDKIVENDVPSDRYEREGEGISSSTHAERKTVVDDHRRRKLLQKERERYKNFLSYFPSIPSLRPGDSMPLMYNKYFMRHGRYRSLSRRIYALGLTEPMLVDLERVSSPIQRNIWGFSALDREAFPAERKETHHPITIKHDPRVEAWTDMLLHGADSDTRETILHNWSAFDEQDRNISWDKLLFYLLDKRPDMALHFIPALASGPEVATMRPEFLADALEHIARLCFLHPNRPHIPDATDFVSVFFSVFRSKLATCSTICSQQLFWDLCYISRPDDLEHVFDLLVETNAYMGFDTLLHFANTFGAAGNHQYGLRCLRRITEGALSSAARSDVVARQRFRWSCALILRKSVRHGKNYNLTNEIVAEFLKLGLELDITMYNVIMHNAMDAGDYTTAFQVYNLLGENGVEPDKYTYSILLHGCTATNNPALFEDFAEHCAKMAIQLRDPWLATEYLYYVYVRHQKADREQLLAVLYSAYSRLFTLEPLQPFQDAAVRAHIAATEGSEVDAARLSPPPAALYIMLQGRIRSLVVPGNTNVLKLYRHFVRLVKDGRRPLLNELARDPIIWNTFLLVFCRQKQFAQASDLIKTMTDSKDDSIPQPNIFTWNLFMRAFFQDKQVRVAERVFEIMKSRGIDPNQDTFEVLLRGYANVQHIERVAEYMGRVSEEKQVDPKLLRMLIKIHDKERLMRALDEARVAREEEERRKREAEELERKRRGELLRFGSLLPGRRLVLSPTSSKATSDVKKPNDHELGEPASKVPEGAEG